MPQSIIVPAARSDHSEDHVTVSQCSNRTIHSEDETLPMLTPRLKHIDRSHKQTKPMLKYTTRRETGSPFIKTFTSVEELDNEFNENVDLSDKKEMHSDAYIDEKIKPTSDSEQKLVFLPRLNDTELKQNYINKRSIDADYIRFPEISNLTNKNGRLALNRSITDLLDPEMEILNKIKHLPRKKRKRRRKKLDSGTPV